VRGWLEGSGVEWPDAVRRLEGAGVAAFVVTQIQVEGLMGGPDLAGLGELLGATDVPVIASGGVGTLDDLRALAQLGVAGAIVGTALYEGRFTVEDAVAACT
jgi:phosphoribosylformimino-5-aminoimidazole carboxamide ribotide isomerase